MRNISLDGCIAPARQHEFATIPRGFDAKLENIHNALKAGAEFVSLVESHFSVLTAGELEALRVEESNWMDRANGSKYQRELKRRNSLLTYISDALLNTYGLEVNNVL